MEIQTVWAEKCPPPDDECDGDGDKSGTPALHEFGLSWYRFSQTAPATVGRYPAVAAVWIRFRALSELETIQTYFHEAKLGPAASFTEALIFADSWKGAEALHRRIVALIERERTADDLGEAIKEETMEDA